MKGSRPLTRQQVKGLLALTSTIREQTLLTLGFCTGYRISELLSLKVSDVSTNGIIHSHVTVKAANTKTKTGRTVLLNADAQKALRRLVMVNRLYLLAENTMQMAISKLSHANKPTNYSKPYLPK